MPYGVILGWSPPLAALVERADFDPDAVIVVTDEAAAVDRLHERGIAVVDADPSSVGPVDEDTGPSVVVVGVADPRYALDLVTRSRDWYPEARLIAYAGPEATTTDRERLRTAADEVLDHASFTAAAVLERSTSAPAVRAFRVRGILRALDDLCVYTHDNPDPDAIASAVALVRLASHIGVDASARFYGQISHQSNRALVNALELPITKSDESVTCDGIALVDHSIPGRNNALESGTPVDLVFDHHRPTGPVDARYADIRESVGATSAILFEYLTEFDVPIDERLATALLYGIRTDTREFRRKVTPTDFRAAASLWTVADHRLLTRIEDPGISRQTLQTIADAIANRTVRGPVLSAFVGACSDKDALSQAAELLVQMEGITIVLVYGIDEATVYASARARGAPAGFDLSMVMRDAFARIGSAGGHENMAGAQIPLGFLGTELDDDDAPIARIISEVIDEQFFESVEIATTVGRPFGAVNASGGPDDVFGDDA